MAGYRKKWKADIGPTIDKFGNKTEFHIYGIGNFEYDIYEKHDYAFICRLAAGLIKTVFARWAAKTLCWYYIKL